MNNKSNHQQDREKVWVALSDLFLDTDVSLSYDYISRVCADSSFSIQELEDILENEVAPVCAINLLSVAGEWAGFDEEWLFKSITQYKNKRRGYIGRIFKRLYQRNYHGGLQADWSVIEQKIIRRRSISNRDL